MSDILLIGLQGLHRPRFVPDPQLQVKLGNDNPDVTPVLQEIALHFDDALISGGITSSILPREASFDSLQIFTYTLNPSFRFGDLGFDRLQIQTPSPVDDVQVWIVGEPVQPLSVSRGPTTIASGGMRSIGVA